MAGATQQQLMQVKSYTEQDKYLLYLVELGIKERYIDLLGENEDYVHAVVKPKIMYELSVIIGKGFTDYFLILADLVQYCASRDIPVGVGRGSSAGSIVAYVLGITEVEPIRFNLIFDRFLNFERNDLPDIDSDVCWARRQEVIDYLVNKYGGDNVAQILTFGTLSPKTLIQDLCRVLKVGHKMVKKLKDAVPEDEKVGVEDCIESPEFMEVMKEANKEDGRLLPAFIKLGGLHRNTSIHAGGVVISTKPIRDLAPVYKPVAKSKANKVSRPVVQYEMQDAEAVGLLKMDLLGLRTVTLVDWAEKDVRRLVDPNFYTRKMSLEQKEAFDIINRGDTDGIFQLEGTGITKFAMDFQVQSFDELIALISLYRPGTLDSGMADSYIRRKRGQEQITYPHPDLEWVLKDTYGIMVYQEQIMQVAGVMCGYSMGQADGLRKAVGKKNKQKIEEELAKFRQYAMDPSRGTRAYDEELTNQMADLIETFGRYG